MSDNFSLSPNHDKLKPREQKNGPHHRSAGIDIAI